MVAAPLDPLPTLLVNSFLHRTPSKEDVLTFNKFLEFGAKTLHWIGNILKHWKYFGMLIIWRENVEEYTRVFLNLRT
jgi:hypothetical protein